MKCPHCGREHPDDFLFCPSTGKKIEILKACANPQCPNLGKHILPVVALFCPVCGKQLENDASPAGKDNSCLRFTVGGVSFKMIPVEGGSFLMGSPYNDKYGLSREKPQHRVTLSDYYIGEAPVTQALWLAVMNANPSRFKGANRPVEQVSWDDSQKFIRRLNLLTGRVYRLPTEAEWEYAARGGNRSQGYSYSGSNCLDSVAWYADNSENETHDVMTKAPNELGLFDMSGNVWEWCDDWYGDYSILRQTNPKGSSSGSERVYRGGNWFNSGMISRVTYRSGNSPSHTSSNLGLRLAL